MSEECIHCPKLRFEPAANGRIFICCAYGGDDPRWKNRVLDLSPKGSERRRAALIPRPAWCKEVRT